MTLQELVAGGGLALSSSLVAVLIAMWPTHRERPVVCLKSCPDGECTRSCLRTCHLVPPAVPSKIAA